MTLREQLMHRSITGLSRLAALLTLLALAIMVYSVLVPAVLPVMLAMSLGHVVGGAGFACFFLAVVLDAARTKPPDSTPRPP